MNYKFIHMLVSLLLVMVINTFVNTSDNLILGLRYPTFYFTIVTVGLIGSITIQLYGSYKLLELIDNKLKERK